MILTCQHCKMPFEHNSPKALFCLRTEDCIAARKAHLKAGDARHYQTQKANHKRKYYKKGKTLRYCRHCDRDFWGRSNQIYCRATPECRKASWVFYQARMRELRRGTVICHCLHCDEDFRGQPGQLYCRKTQECKRASWCYAQAKRKAAAKEQAPESRRDFMAKSRESKKKQMCSYCKRRPGAPGNHFLCGRCFAPQSSHVEPQATEYDPYRGQPRL